MSAKEVIEEHVTSMGIPPSTGRHILEAKTVVEDYLKSIAEIARINDEADTSQLKIKAEMQELNEEFWRRQQELDDEKNRRHAAITNKSKTAEAETKEALDPLLEQVKRVERIITLLRIAETIQPVEDIEDSHISTYHGEYLEWLGYFYKDDLLKLRLLITENRKPKNKYSLLAYGRCAFSGFSDESLIRKIYEYGTPNLNERQGGRFTVRMELGSFASMRDAKAYAQRNANKPLKEFISDYEALKQEYLDITAKFRLSDFERITAEKEGAK